MKCAGAVERRQLPVVDGAREPAITEAREDAHAA